MKQPEIGGYSEAEFEFAVFLRTVDPKKVRLRQCTFLSFSGYLFIWRATKSWLSYRTYIRRRSLRSLWFRLP